MSASLVGACAAACVTVRATKIVTRRPLFMIASRDTAPQQRAHRTNLATSDQLQSKWLFVLNSKILRTNDELPKAVILTTRKTHFRPVSGSPQKQTAGK